MTAPSPPGYTEINIVGEVVFLFLVSHGGYFSHIVATPGGRILMLCALFGPFLLSLLLWLLLGLPFFARHRILSSLAVAIFCLVVYRLQPLQYGTFDLMQGFAILITGFGASFYVFDAAPDSPPLLWLQQRIRRFFRWLAARFF